MSALCEPEKVDDLPNDEGLPLAFRRSLRVLTKATQDPEKASPSIADAHQSPLSHSRGQGNFHPTRSEKVLSYDCHPHRDPAARQSFPQSRRW